MSLPPVFQFLWDARMAVCEAYYHDGPHAALRDVTPLAVE
jgi:hypothetical protein